MHVIRKTLRQHPKQLISVQIMTYTYMFLCSLEIKAQSSSGI